MNHEAGIRRLNNFVAILSPHLREPLLSYVTGGAMGSLFDAEEDTLELSTFPTFEMEQLLGMKERWALPVLLYLFRRIEKSLHGQPALLILDEA